MTQQRNKKANGADPLADLRLRLLTNGYTPLPADAKGVYLDGWSNVVDGKQCGISPTADDIAAWSKKYPQWQSTSVRCGDVAGIDVDVPDKAAADQIQLEALWHFPMAMPTRVGNPPKFLMMARTQQPFPKLWTDKYLLPDGGSARVEVLGLGQQFIAFGIHPKTGEPYKWFGGDPTTVPVAELPEVSREEVVDFLRAAEAILAAQGWKVDPKAARANYVERAGDEQQRRDYAGAPTDWDKLEAALDKLTDIVDRETRYRILAALKHYTDDPKHALALAFRWASHSLNFDPAKIQRTWNSFGPREGSVGLGTIYHLAREAEREATGAAGFEAQDTGAEGVSLTDFIAFLPDHSYVFLPTGEAWAATSVNARIPPVPVDGTDKPTPAAKWLDQHRAVEQKTWAPGEPVLIRDRLISDGGWMDRVGVTTFNLYRPPIVIAQPGDVDLWLDHARRLYGDDAEHIIRWFAHRVQRPQEKLNHALILGGAQGIGKDTLIEPVKRGVGPWNFQEVGPKHLLGRFNSFAKAVILRVNEARNLGELDRYAFYEHMKNYTAAPPDVLRIDEKFICEYTVMNVVGVIITTNHKTDGIYLPADDRRHFVGWSDLVKEQFGDEYWPRMWDWFNKGGAAQVVDYLQKLDLSDFNPKAPPPKTRAFWDIVNASRPPENAELADALDALGRPEATTLEAVQQAVTEQGGHVFAQWLRDHKNRRRIPHRLEECGYAPVHNPDAKDGLWKLKGRRRAVYGRSDRSLRDQLAAADRLTR
jgi:Family of unknown function (DUF5906)/Primase C terminal 2 (PriCT-2)